MANIQKNFYKLLKEQKKKRHDSQKKNMIEKKEQNIFKNIIRRILSTGKEKDLGEYNRKLLNKVWNSKKNQE